MGVRGGYGFAELPNWKDAVEIWDGFRGSGVFDRIRLVAAI